MVIVTFLWGDWDAGFMCYAVQNDCHFFISHLNAAWPIIDKSCPLDVNYYDLYFEIVAHVES